MDRWKEEALISFFRKNKRYRKLLRQLTSDRMDEWAFHQLVLILKNEEEIKVLLEFLEKSYITEDFVKAMNDPFIVSKLKVFDVSVENPLAEDYTLADINEIITDNYGRELKRYCKESAYTTVLTEHEIKNSIEDSIQSKSPVIAFYRRGVWIAHVRVKVEDNLHLLININLSARNGELEEKYEKKDLQKIAEKIADINTTVSNGYFFMKRVNDNCYTVNFQVSYSVYRNYEFDEEIFKEHLSSALATVKKSNIF